GPVDIARVTLERVELGAFRDERVRASVNSGQMTTSLLGMSYLNRFETLQIQDGRLTLIR
ncbi:MAG: retroviral-like aspartic protease family protein, partial [Pseudomonadota bacterium]